MKIIDIHAHIFPDKIAEKASANVGAFYNLSMKHDGKIRTRVFDSLKMKKSPKALI
jgi:hypothetical protein